MCRITHFAATLLFGMFFAFVLFGQETLKHPDDESLRDHVSSASQWLSRHVVNGKLSIDGDQIPLSLIAWKDPTLHQSDPNYLTGYTITDTLWASYALKVDQSKLANELAESLRRIQCDGNSLQEVIWKPIEQIHHRPADPDFVHGQSLGTMLLGDGRKVDVRKFTLVNDPVYTVGHPELFAEHAVYQAFFEYRQGQIDAARNRIRNILDESRADSQQKIKWNNRAKVLVDSVNAAKFDEFVNHEKDRCRQYSFKIALVIYATKFIGLQDEFHDQLSAMQKVLVQAQQVDGGISHHIDVDNQGNIIQGLGCTGEATAIFILASCIQPHAQ